MMINLLILQITISITTPTLNFMPQENTDGLKHEWSHHVSHQLPNTKPHYWDHRVLLNRAGDIEQNPGPCRIFKFVCDTFSKNKTKLKYVNTNCQSLTQKRTQIETLLNDLGRNTVYGFTETWFKDHDHVKLWEMKSEHFETFRIDRKTKKGGGIMLLVPKSLHPKERKDLNHLNQKLFESLWVECNLNNNSSMKRKQLINISYNPQKSLTDAFLEELSTSIDYAIVENKPITLMGDYNINYLNPTEKQSLDTITVPYGFRILNTSSPTRIQNNSKSLIDYIITDLQSNENFETMVCDTPLRTRKNTDIDHLATVCITDIQMKSKSKAFIKEIFDKSNYNKDTLCDVISRSNWGNFYNQSCPEGMFTIFTQILEDAIKQCVPKKRVFIRNDKSSLTIHENWVSQETKKLYRKLDRSMHPTDQTYLSLKRVFLENLEANRLEDQIANFNNLTTEKDKWKFINESRNARRTKTEITSLKNCFGDHVTDQKKIANLLNFRFSKLGDYMGTARPYDPPTVPETKITKKVFSFQPISLYDCKKQLLCLNKNKPIGPCSIPAWVLKDCRNDITEPLCYLINAFIMEGKFPNHLKHALVTPIYKKGNREDTCNYRPISITPALSKIFEKVLRKRMNIWRKISY